jgi:hypothetical protein
MHLSEVDPCPRKGQWWARLKPLALIYVPENPAHDSCIFLHVFSPDEPYASPWEIIGPMGQPDFRILPFHLNVPKNFFPTTRTGDAFVTNDRSIFFIVTNNEDLTILSDAPMSEEQLARGARRLQQGPEPPNHEATIFDKLRGDNEHPPEAPSPKPEQIEIEPHSPVDPTNPDA